jgi:hypothetical protein
MLKRLFALAALIFLAASASGGDRPTWTFDSIAPQTADKTTPEQQIYSVLLNQIDLWNRRDLDGYMQAFWNSPELLVIVQAQQIEGWANLAATYQRGYPDRSKMGTLSLERVKIRQMGDDWMALAWSQIHETGGDTFTTEAIIFRKFDDGFKIIYDQCSILEL